MLQNSINTIIKLFERKSAQPLQNSKRIERYIFDATEKGIRITFFDWECPPRALGVTDSGMQFINYDVDLDRIFCGETIDKYTEFPRAVSQRKEEIDTLNYLKQSGMPFRFVKVIADTNAYYITPESVKIIGQERVKCVFKKFQTHLKIKTKNYPVEVEVYRFIEILKPFRKIYEGVFQEAMKILTTSPDIFVGLDVIEQQIERTKEHIGIKNNKQAKEVALRVIASYGAEGVILEELSKTPAFSNCVWMNLREVDQRTIAIANCMRKRKGLDPLPMWFPK